MTINDLVMFSDNFKLPVIGQVVGFTAKRVRIAVRYRNGYVTVLRAIHNARVAKKMKGLL